MIEIYHIDPSSVEFIKVLDGTSVGPTGVYKYGTPEDKAVRAEKVHKFVQLVDGKPVSQTDYYESGAIGAEGLKDIANYWVEKMGDAKPFFTGTTTADCELEISDLPVTVRSEEE